MALPPLGNFYHVSLSIESHRAHRGCFFLSLFLIMIMQIGMVFGIPIPREVILIHACLFVRPCVHI